MISTMLPAKSLFLNESLSDVEIKVQSSDGYVWRFPAHSTFLCSGSAWMKERIEEIRVHGGDETTTITFVDLSVDTVLLLLRYLYTGELSDYLKVNSLLDLLGASVRCRVPQLKAECEARILGLVKVLNVGQVLERATDLMVSGRGTASVIEACRRVVLSYGQVIFSSDLVKQLSRRNLEYVVASRELNVQDESVVFRGLWRWGKETCCRSGLKVTDENIADSLDGILEHVNFSSIEDIALPPVVKERYCLSKKQKTCCSISGSTDGNESQKKCRCPYRLPGDILHHSFRKFVTAYGTPNVAPISVEPPPLNDRLLCGQVSFSSGVFLTALALQAQAGDSCPGLFALTVTSEDDGLEICREDILWSGTSKGSELSDGQILTTVLRLSRLLTLSSRSHYSFHLLYKAKAYENSGRSTETVNRWMFPATVVRRNMSPPDENQCRMTMHCERVVAISAIYYIPGAETMW